MLIKSFLGFFFANLLQLLLQHSNIGLGEGGKKEMFCLSCTACQVLHTSCFFSQNHADEYTGLRYEPKLADLMNEIAVKLPDKWQDIGRGLGLEEYELRQIQSEHGWQQSTNQFFSSVFEKWHSGE